MNTHIASSVGATLMVSVVLLSSCTPTHEYPEIEGESIPRAVSDGVVVDVHPNGQTAAECTYVGGFKNGFERQWYVDGTRRSEGAFDSGHRGGLWLTWHSNGQLESEISYVKGRRSGDARAWWANGTLSSQGRYDDDVPNGFWRHWRSDGSVVCEGEYANGLRTGVWNAWTEDGDVDSAIAGNYSNGDRR